jgi:catechol 2,3-dioxygenase-like lactoylglutathione lyase family enzyme
MEETMFSSGNVTVYVSNMDRAVRFYTGTLGLRLAYRFGDHWDAVELGKGLTIGLHPASAEMPAGRRGSMSIGLELAEVDIDEPVEKLRAEGVQFQGPVVREGKAGAFAGFTDPDGNQLYLAQLNWSHVSQGERRYQQE